MKIKLRKTDIEFSKYLRKKRKYICERCKLFFPEGKGLQVSHYWGRRRENTRFDEMNCDILCFSDHQNFEENPQDYRDWKLKKLGKKKFKRLELASSLYKKRDDALDFLWIKQLEKEYASKEV